MTAYGNHIKYRNTMKSIIFHCASRQEQIWTLQQPPHCFIQITPGWCNIPHLSGPNSHPKTNYTKETPCHVFWSNIDNLGEHTEAVSPIPHKLLISGSEQNPTHNCVQARRKREQICHIVCRRGHIRGAWTSINIRGTSVNHCSATCPCLGWTQQGVGLTQRMRKAGACRDSHRSIICHLFFLPFTVLHTFWRMIKVVVWKNKTKKQLSLGNASAPKHKQPALLSYSIYWRAGRQQQACQVNQNIYYCPR